MEESDNQQEMKKETKKEEKEEDPCSSSFSSSSSSSSASSSLPSGTKEGIIKADGDLFKEKFEANKPIMVLFTSKTCGPCRILKPILSKVVKEYGDRVDFLEIDIEESYDLTVEREVVGTPTVHVYHNKEQVTILRGIKKKTEYV